MITEYKGHTITVEQDEYLENPREYYDHLATMVCGHRKYTLGDVQDMSYEELFKNLQSKNNVALPLYMYDHGGLTINTTGFDCPWDSGFLGIIFVSKEKVREEMGWKNITKKRMKYIEDRLLEEVVEYDHYLRGDMYWYSIDNAEGNTVDTCHMFMTAEDALESAKEAL